MAEEKAGKDVTEMIRKNPWIAATVVLGIFSLVLLFFMFKGGASVSKTEIGQKAVSFINTQLLQGQGNVTLDSVNEKNGLYEVTVNFNGQVVPAYFTEDGGYFVGTQLVPITLSADNANTQQQTETPQEMIKSDKPKVELFVMTHCPYGTQAEKGILPAINALGNKIDFDVKFVHYFMHGDKEEQETYTQTCIREQQSGKFIQYLDCFLEDGNSTRCLKKYSLNVDSCAANKSKEYYAADSEMSQGYGVQGSPTLIINGVEAQYYPRSPSVALSTICAAFNTAPSECNKNVSTDAASPGFGTAAAASSGTTGNATASCGG